ncbi:MAG: shikimate kinase [Spirosomataceae bacterium]
MINIFLLGMPSSGKSTLGRQLAKQLGYHYFDMDKVIEELEQMTVAEIFAQKGEEYFRKLERKVIKTLPIDSRLVVSTGGGAPCFFDNISLIKSKGRSIYFDVPVETLYERMLNTKRNDRPLYQKDDPTLITTLRQKYIDRQPFYTQADLVIAGADITIEQVLEALHFKAS